MTIAKDIYTTAIVACSYTDRTTPLETLTRSVKGSITKKTIITKLNRYG